MWSGSSSGGQHRSSYALVDLLGYVGSAQKSLPISGNRNEGKATRVVVQNPGDTIEDGHEVNFQTARPKSMYRCVLADLAAGWVPTVRDTSTDACW